MVEYKLDTIVKEYLAQIGDSNLSRYLRFYQYALSGVREWNMDLTGLPNIVDLEVDNTDRAALPADYLNYTKIGICGSDGIVYPLAERNNICLDKHYDSCGNEVRHDSSYALGDGVAYTNPGFVNDHFRNGQVLGRFFGIGGGQNANGYFRIDKSSGQIVLLNLICSVQHLTLEYISDITMANGDFLVHPFMLETLKSWIFWQSIAFDKNVGLGEKQLAKQNYDLAYRKSKKRFTSTPLSEWYKAIRSGNMGAPKF